MGKQRLREVGELAQGHIAHEQVDPSNLVPDSKLLVIMLNCFPKLGFRQVKGFARDHRSAKYRTRPRAGPSFSQWIMLKARGRLNPVSVRPQSHSHLWHHPDPVWVLSIPSSDFPSTISQCCVYTSCIATTAQVGEGLAASPPPSSLQSLSWSAVCWSSDRLITVKSGLLITKGTPQIHPVPLWLPTFWNQTFLTKRIHHPRQSSPIPPHR